MTGKKPTYWFARFRPLSREDFGIKSSEVPNLDLVRDRFLPFSGAWKFQALRPIALQGWVLWLGGALCFAIAILTFNASPPLAIGCLVAVAVLAFVIPSRTDPEKFVEEYDGEREAALTASGKYPWLKPDSADRRDGTE